VSRSRAEVDESVAETPLDGRQLILKEWQDWNRSSGWKPDVANLINDAFGLQRDFSSEAEARQFMNDMYDKVIVSVRTELGKEWKP